MSTKHPKYEKVEEYNFLLPYGFSKNNFLSCLEYNPKPTDIFICTYPKCGTTWMEYIVYLILNDGNPLPKDMSKSDFIHFLEACGKKWIENQPDPRIIRTHLPYNLIPKNPKTKYIYVARNPKDCVVSFYYHTVGFSMCYDFLDGKFDDYFELFMKGEVDCGDYFDNLLSWYPHRNDSNVFFTTYESMKLDIKSCILNLAKFLGEPYASKLVNDSNILDKIIKNSQFSEMKKDKAHFNAGRSAKVTDFLRKGEIGDFRNHLSEEQSKRLDEKMRIRTQGTDIAQLWSNDIIK